MSAQALESCEIQEVHCASTQVGECVDGYYCVRYERTLPSTGECYAIYGKGSACGAGTGQAVFGKVVLPYSITMFNLQTGEGGGIGVFGFANTLLFLFFSICVVWFMMNLIHTGYLYLSSPGDAKVLEKFKEALFYPAIGMVLLAAAFLIVSLIGSFVFGNPSYILEPQLPTAVEFAPVAP